MDMERVWLRRGVSVYLSQQSPPIESAVHGASAYDSTC